ncbi:MAG: VPLPA-CTERM sorting domain-containing protein [Desulfobacterales bacterium]|nr:MAG: VPLPA-CTERM sorting domain-containing protein [Desulfobacterales bacterium]
MDNIDNIQIGFATLYEPAYPHELYVDQIDEWRDWGSDGPPDLRFDSAKLRIEIETVPLPGSVWLLASGLIGFAGVVRKFYKTNG